ncbi:MAG TPA: hypothetical protein VLB32_02970 [Candidatus Acidoferrales bacterium]|nr:hypothetical protein [Candidatus Acidoferrales bacterium]
MLALARRHPILATLLLVLWIATGTAAAATYRAGLVRVSVEEKRPGGDNVRLIVPGILLTTGLKLVPDNQLREGLRDARPWLPVAAALAKELRNYPDASFIEVSSAQEQMRIATRGGVLVVDVSSPDETVHVSIPLTTLADLTAELNARRAEL